MGFSVMLDIIGATIIGGLLMLTIFRLTAKGQEAQITYGNDKSLQSEMVNVGRIIEEDFRKIGYCADPTKVSDTTKFVISADSSSLKFMSDFDRNGTKDYIHYYLGPTSELAGTVNPRDRILYRVINGGTPFIVSTHTTNFYIKYFDALHQTLTTPVGAPTLIAFMEVSFQLEDAEAYNQQYSSAYWEQIRLTSRNLAKR